MLQTASNALLRELASQLLEESSRVPELLSATDVAQTDLVARYVRAQSVSGPKEFQLPEPILHPIVNPDVLVVGFNPNYGEDEVIPRYGVTLEEYVAFYAERFAPHRRDSVGRPAGKRRSDGSIYPIGHYTRIERLVTEVLGTETALGVNTVYCDAIPWKWKRENFPGFRKADAAAGYTRLHRIVLALKPKVVLTLGERSSRIVGEWTKDRPRPIAPRDNWPTLQVASYHPGARRGQFNRSYMTLVQEALEAALAHH